MENGSDYLFDTIRGTDLSVLVKENNPEALRFGVGRSCSRMRER